MHCSSNRQSREQTVADFQNDTRVPWSAGASRVDGRRKSTGCSPGRAAHGTPARSPVAKRRETCCREYNGADGRFSFQETKEPFDVENQRQKTRRSNTRAGPCSKQPRFVSARIQRAYLEIPMPRTRARKSLFSSIASFGMVTIGSVVAAISSPTESFGRKKSKETSSETETLLASCVPKDGKS